MNLDKFIIIGAAILEGLELALSRIDEQLAEIGKKPQPDDEPPKSPEREAREKAIGVLMERKPQTGGIAEAARVEPPRSGPTLAEVFEQFGYRPEIGQQVYPVYGDTSKAWTVVELFIPQSVPQRWQLRCKRKGTKMNFVPHVLRYPPGFTFPTNRKPSEF